MSITNFNYSTMPVYSNTQDSYKLDADQQKMVHDHIVYYNNWGWRGGGLAGWFWLHSFSRCKLSTWP